MASNNITLTGLAGVFGQPGLDIHSKSSWNDDMEAAPGEDNVLGVGGYEKFGLEFVFAEFCSSGSEEDADALEA